MDHPAEDLTDVVENVVDTLVENGQLARDDKDTVLQALLLKRK